MSEIMTNIIKIKPQIKLKLNKNAYIYKIKFTFFHK